MKKICLLSLLALTIISCNTARESYQFLDDDHKSFYINGVSASEGYNAIIKSLEEIGFQMGEVNEVDLSILNKGITYSTILRSSRQFTRQEYNQLTNGLFVDLPSGDIIFDEVNNNGCNVYLSWNKSGIVKQVVIQASNSFIEKDAVEINKRLASLFPYSKIGNSNMGYLTYYTDYGVEVYYTNDYYLSIEKKN